MTAINCQNQVAAAPWQCNKNKDGPRSTYPAEKLSLTEQPHLVSSWGVWKASILLPRQFDWRALPNELHTHLHFRTRADLIHPDLGKWLAAGEDSSSKLPFLDSNLDSNLSSCLYRSRFVNNYWFGTFFIFQHEVGFHQEGNADKTEISTIAWEHL